MNKLKKLLKNVTIFGLIVSPIVSVASSCSESKEVGIKEYNITDLTKPYDDGVYRSKYPMGAYKKMLPLGDPEGAQELMSVANNWYLAHENEFGTWGPGPRFGERGGRWGWGGWGNPRCPYRRISRWNWAYCPINDEAKNQMINLYAVYDAKIASQAPEDRVWHTEEYLNMKFI